MTRLITQPSQLENIEVVVACPIVAGSWLVSSLVLKTTKERSDN